MATQTKLDEFLLDILGPRPVDVSPIELAELITHFETAVRAEIEALAASQSSAAMPPRIGSAVPISLVGISEGSDRLHFAVVPQARHAVAHISKAVGHGEFRSLSRAAWKALHDMSQVTKRRAWGLKFVGNKKHGIEELVIQKGAEITPPDELAVITGSTSIRARVIRAGGATPRAELRVPNRSSLLYVDVTETDAKFLGQRLYETVVLEGVAKWDPETWAVLEFSVTRVTDYRTTRVSDAFKALADVSGKAWADVDAEDFVKRVRSEHH